MKTLCYLNDQLELLKEIQSRRLSTAVKEDIERVQECIEELQELSKPCECHVGTLDLYEKSDSKIKSDVNKVMDASARKIVAMLFWTYKVHKRLNTESNALVAKMTFQEAYKILKGTKCQE